jgi:hypothetical protein
MAEDQGYKATIEKEILGGIGKVDVALEKSGTPAIACEISMTTNIGHEFGNIQKCLAAGYEFVVLISSERKILNDATKLAESEFAADALAKAKFLAPEEFLSFLQEQEAHAAGKEERVRGYKVKTKFRTVTDAEKKAKKQIIAKTVLQALKKMKS